MPTFENTRTVLGEAGALDALLAHTLTVVADDELVQLSGTGLRYQPQLETVYIPNAARVSVSAFLNSPGIKRTFFATNKETKQSFSASELRNARRAILYVPDNLVEEYVAAYIEPDNPEKLRYIGVSRANSDALEWEETEITDSWTQILARCANGTALSIYHPGQFKAIDLGDNGTIEFQIIGKNLDELADGSGNAALTWFNRERTLRFDRRMNPAQNGTTIGTGGIGGMEHCEGQTYLDETIFPLMPQELKNGIKMVKKYTSYKDSSDTRVVNELTTHRLWFASLREMCILGTDSETTGPQYIFAFPDDEGRKRKAYLSSDTTNYWLRTGNSLSQFRRINPNGASAITSSENAIGICFGFCT